MNSANDSLEKLDITLTSRNLAKQIFAADLPEQYIKRIPAQTLYIALKRNGLQSSADLLEIASLEQCRLMIDFDCWQKSYFYEDNFWEWLALTTEGDDLALLQKMLKCFDLKIITLLIAKHVQYEFVEEPTDNPPGPGYFTPDKGRTWLSINIEDSDRHFLFGRLLALIFETDANLFYKLLSLSTTQTSTVLEEEAYLDKSKRLYAEGIPEYEIAAEVNNPANENSISAALKEVEGKNGPAKIIDIQAVEPLIFDSSLTKLLSQLLQDMTIREDLENELTYIMNGAIVMWDTEFYEYERVMHLTDKVKGAINLGLEKCQELSNLSAIEIYKKIGLIKVYQLGLTQLKKLRTTVNEAKKVAKESLAPEIELIFASVIQPLPEMPVSLKEGYKSEDAGNSISANTAPIEHLSEIRRITQMITSS